MPGGFHRNRLRFYLVQDSSEQESFQNGNRGPVLLSFIPNSLDTDARGPPTQQSAMNLFKAK